MSFINKIILLHYHRNQIQISKPKYSPFQWHPTHCNYLILKCEMQLNLRIQAFLKYNFQWFLGDTCMHYQCISPIVLVRIFVYLFICALILSVDYLKNGINNQLQIVTVSLPWSGIDSLSFSFYFDIKVMASFKLKFVSLFKGI